MSQLHANEAPPKPRRFQRFVLGAGMSVALFIIERRVVKAIRRRGGPTKNPPTRGVNVSHD